VLVPEVTIYVPVGAISGLLFIYAFVGIILYMPLVMWQARFINNATAWGTWDNMPLKTLLKGIGVCILAWPMILGYNIKTEISYRKKGYL
jgi:hypothetical protein